MVFLKNKSDEYCFLFLECGFTDALFLSSVENMNKALLNTRLESYYLSAFYELANAIERFLKISLLSQNFYLSQIKSNHENEDISNLSYTKYLEDGHDLVKLYGNLNKQLLEMGCDEKEIYRPLENSDSLIEVFAFLTEFGKFARYFNTDFASKRIHKKQVSKYEDHPLLKWQNICQKVINTKSTIPYNIFSPISKENHLSIHKGNQIFVYSQHQASIVKKATKIIYNEISDILTPIFKNICKLPLLCKNGTNHLPQFDSLFVFFKEKPEIFSENHIIKSTHVDF